MAFVPYCGSPPAPGQETWNTDPILIGALAVSGFCYFLLARRARLHAPEALSFTGGLVLMSVAFISPLCSMSVSLFSARIAQHMVVLLGAAPLIAYGLHALLQSEPDRRRLWTSTMALFGTLWFWHTPQPYDETLRSNIVYWLMHLSTIGAALWFWTEIFAGDGWQAFLATTFTGTQMCILGAILALSRTPLFAVHGGTTAPWGLTQLQDQWLGGLLMWIPGGIWLTGYSIYSLSVFFHQLETRQSIQVSPAPRSGVP